MSKSQPMLDNIVHAHLVVREASARVARSDDTSEIETALTSLAEILPVHFHAEEHADGFFDHLRRSLVGNAEAKVAALVQDHRAMEHELAAIMATTSRDTAWVERGKRLARRLQDHERLESRLGAEGLETF